MNTPVFPPLLPPGLHRMSLDDIKAACVDSCPNDRQRSQRYVNLIAWIDGLRAAQVTAIRWIDGSFCDGHACADRSAIKQYRGIDLYMETPSNEIEKLHRQAYWNGLFGLQHDGVSAKGFVEFQL